MVYGIIGRRVADIATDWRIKSIANRLRLFASTEDAKGRWSQLARDRQETGCDH